MCFFMEIFEENLNLNAPLFFKTQSISRKTVLGEITKQLR